MANFVIFLFTFASFEFMWARVRKTNPDPEFLRVSEALWWTLGYLLFIWTSLSLIQIWAVTPDMLMAGLLFLAAGLIGKIRSGDTNHRLFLSLGMILGLGYLSKTFMISVTPIFLGLLWIVQKQTWSAVRKTLLTAAMFLFISLPFILLISNAKGEFTLGAAGKVTYLRHVVGIPTPHWQGEPSPGMMPIHLSRIIHESPTVYEFDGPVGGTYPISTDPSYWYEGITPRLEFASLLTRLFASGLVYAELFLQQQGVLVACVLALYLMHRRENLGLRETLQSWTLAIPAIIAFALYGMVLVEGRYVGAFILLLWADVLANIRLADTASNRAWLKVLGVIACAGVLTNILVFNLEGFNRLNFSGGSRFTSPAAPAAKPVDVARALQELNINPDDKVGVIGYAYDSFWARLARVKVVAELLDVDSEEFWRGDEALQQSVLQAFFGTGAKAVVAEHVPKHAPLDHWYQVGESSYYIFRFGGE
jgi:hypothetical protein